MILVRPWFLLLLALCAHGNRAGAQKLVTRETQVATADFADFVHFVHSLQSPRSPVTPPRNVDDFLLFAPSLVETTHVDTLPKQAWKKGGKNFPLHEPQRQYTDQEAHRATGSSEEGFVAAWIGAMSSSVGASRPPWNWWKTHIPQRQAKLKIFFQWQKATSCSTTKAFWRCFQRPMRTTHFPKNS